ncbi:MAG: hypothetical protein AVDCRST_MAG87-1626 [uncultured Thermomicrobiales bacterium]|uniref:Uncharacterized protein n=1 Tax=uncultured Thermomicrobiales bacterium TaxID=1645740 RepID=A0A6J4UX00_9BACT|nr:MAG: hypothetical protein AVDCRST_MAG87-1626 [uncultured Thermomicrobiales bacterium]
MIDTLTNPVPIERPAMWAVVMTFAVTDATTTVNTASARTANANTRMPRGEP